MYFATFAGQRQSEKAITENFTQKRGTSNLSAAKEANMKRENSTTKKK